LYNLEYNIFGIPKPDYTFILKTSAEFSLKLSNKITDFDKQHLDHLNPGDLHDAPYHSEHMVASVIELLLLKELGVNLQEYDRKIKEL
jgi:hypothetical protein